MTESAGLPEDMRPELADLDLWPTERLVAQWVAEQESVVRAVDAARAQLVTAVDAVAERLLAGGRLFYVGAGTPGRLAWLDAVELPPTFGTPPELVQAVVAGGSAAFERAIEAEEDDTAAAPAALTSRGLAAGDVVVGVTASGRTPFVVSALQHARATGALTVAICSAPETPAAAAAEVVVEVLTGGEMVAGSTRLKAGTAQKVVLNLLSTAVMVRLGHTYGQLMVGVAPDNAKLRTRAVRTVAVATGLGAEEAAAMLARCDGDAKVAIVAALARVGLDEAQAALRAAGGNVRAALTLVGIR